MFTGTETAAQVQAAQSTQNTAIQAAFSTFMTSAAAMVWLAGGRSSFSGIPASYANLFKIRKDIMIVEFTRFAAQSSAAVDMSAQQVLEKNFSTKMIASPAFFVSVVNASGE